MVTCLWHLGIRNQGGHTNAQSLQQIYTQYLAFILTMMLSTFTHSNSVIDANKLWIEQLVQLFMSGRNTLLRMARFDRLPNMSEQVDTYVSLFRSAIPHTCESHSHNRPSNKNSPHNIVSKSRKIAHQCMLYSLYHQTLSNTNNPAIIEQLQCPILLCLYLWSYIM